MVGDWKVEANELLTSVDWLVERAKTIRATLPTPSNEGGRITATETVYWANQHSSMIGVAETLEKIADVITRSHALLASGCKYGVVE